MSSTLESLRANLLLLVKSQSTKLCFNNRRLTALPKNIGEFHFLTEIDIKTNFLYDLPDSFKMLSKLQVLDLRMNRFSTLPSSIAFLSNLTVLHISHNRIKDLEHNVLGRLVSLRILNVAHNEISELPPSFGNLRHLEVLNVSHNQLSNFPDSLCELVDLRELFAEYNFLSRLPFYFGQLVQLEVLHLQKNHLLELPESFSELQNLRVLDVAANQIRLFPMQFSDMNIKELHMECNPLLKLELVPSVQEAEVLPLKEIVARYIMKNMQSKRAPLRAAVRSNPEVKAMLSQCSQCARCGEFFLSIWLECVHFAKNGLNKRLKATSGADKLEGIPERALLCSYDCFNAPGHQFFGIGYTDQI